MKFLLNTNEPLIIGWVLYLSVNKVPPTLYVPRINSYFRVLISIFYLRFTIHCNMNTYFLPDDNDFR